VAALFNRPLDAFEDIEVPAVPGVIEHSARIDQSFICDSVPWAARRVQWTDRAADTVSAVPDPVVERLLVSNEILRYDLPLRKVRMRHVEAGVQHGHFDVRSR
jgi:hypothetical protein